MAYTINGRTRIHQALMEYEPSSESKDSVKRAIKASEEKSKFNQAQAGISKSPHKTAMAYFTQYEQSMSSEIAKQPYHYQRKGEPVQTTVGQFVQSKVRNLTTYADKAANSDLSFNRLIKKRVREMDRSIDLGYGYERNRDKGEIEFND
ncbi:hypothetical protein U8V72_19950 [Priestia filamentosa]|uniref:hypothetical protein n=1 Tax=Priestia filamentosa TaxID=1402861 RepID=UPI00397C1883